MLNVKNIHCIGVGGIGVSAVAKWFLGRGGKVSGSDMHPSDIIDELDKLGVTVKIGHFVDNVPRETELIVYSRAVSETNVERVLARERGITQLSYAEFLGELAKEKKTIAVSGTNGKSSTTAMIAKILIDAGLDPTVFVGSKMSELEFGNMRDGKSEWLVVEACEYMASMLEIKPTIAVITNIEEDHLDFYTGGITQIRETFQKWIEGAEYVIINADDLESQKLIAENLISFRIEDRKNINQIQDFFVVTDFSELHSVSSDFKINLTSLQKMNIELSLPGKFNAMNAGAGVVVSWMLNINEAHTRSSLLSYKGIWRRFERVGIWKGAEVYSDYAHHPTAIKGTLKAFREFYPNKRLVVVFEPHQHSRTQELFDEFTESFDEADVVIISEIYAVSGRIEQVGVTSKDLAEKIKSRGKNDIIEYVKDYIQAESKLRDLVEKNDIIVIMGAGTIDNLARKIAI